MNPRGLCNSDSKTTNSSENKLLSNSETEKENEIVQGLAYRIDAIHVEEKSNQPLSPPLAGEDFTMKKHLAEMVETFKDKLLFPDIVAEIIVKNKLNIMIIDLYGFAKGFAISFLKFGEEEEIFHGEYSYGVGILDYIKDGEIPYEVLDHLHKYNFRIFYDGYVMCQIRSHFKVEDNFNSHFIFLKQSIQTIDGECAMKCKSDSNLDDDEVRADLISQYSPGISLDPAAALSPRFDFNNWRQNPFITPCLKHIIMAEKTRYEEKVAEMQRRRNSRFYNQIEEEILEKEKGSSNLEDEELSAEAALISDKATEYKSSMLSYLNARKMCFPDPEHFPDKGSLHKYVEIEKFVYEYAICTKAGNTESIQRKLRISVVDPRENYYYYYLQGNVDSGAMSIFWQPIGGREPLDTYIMTLTETFVKEEQRSGEITVTHIRFFGEQVRVCDGSMKIITKKLEVPVSQVIACIPAPTQQPNEKGFQEGVETSSETVPETSKD